MILDRVFLSHSHHEEECQNHEHNNHKGILGAGSISLHSLMDGIIVGLSFQVSTAIGTMLAIAIFAHAFSDGINVVNMIVRVGGEIKEAKKWLFIDSIAPALGNSFICFYCNSRNIFPVLVSILQDCLFILVRVIFCQRAITNIQKFGQLFLLF
jgi:ZIP family zinc transporter